MTMKPTVTAPPSPPDPTAGTKKPEESSEMDLLLKLPSSRPNNNKDLRIAIIGGGVAGLVTARVLKSRGFTNLTVLEANDKVGGVWAYASSSASSASTSSSKGDSESSSSSLYSIQTPGSLYEFPDMALPQPKDYKNASDVQQYCQDYVTQHELGDLIRLNTKVENIERRGTDSEDEAGEDSRGSHGWTLTVRTTIPLVFAGKDHGKRASITRSNEEKEFYDFVILATGLYSGEHKFIPKVEGLEENFKGKVCHSQDYATTTTTTSNSNKKQPETKAKKTKGKQVVVIGFGKSAQDVVMNAALANADGSNPPPILLFQQSHWCVPRKVLGLIPMEWLIYSRFGQGTLPSWQPHQMGWMESLFQACGIIWLYWRIVELLFTLQLGWFGSLSHLRPTLAIENDMYCGHGVICHPDLFPMMKQGRIKPIKGEIEKVTPDGKLVLKDGTILEDVDEIVFATGYRRQIDYLPQELRSTYIPGEGFYAYRHMFMPGVTNICFLNSNVTTFSNITTPGIQAAWLAELLLGNFMPENIKADVEADKEWRQSHLMHATTNDSRSIFIQLHQIRYWDRLLRDMGLQVKRKSVMAGPGGVREPVLTALANFFVPLASADYKTVVTGEEFDAKNKSSSPSYAKNYSPSWWFEWSILALLIGSWLIGWKAMAAQS